MLRSGRSDMAVFGGGYFFPSETRRDVASFRCHNRAVLTFCVLLWANEGCEDDLTRFEDAVLRLMPHHRGRVLSRVRTSGTPDQPTEVHVLQFDDADGLDSYMNDPRRLAMLDERDRVIAKTERIDAQLLA